MNTSRILSVTLAACVVLEVGFLAPGAEPEADRPAADRPAAEKPPRKPRIAVTISKETTFFTGPLRRDGYVDYVAALNELASKGVTPENNAAVPLCQAFGPAEIAEENRERYFRMLGIERLPEEGKYVVTFSDYVDRLVAERGVSQEQPGETSYRGQLDKQFDRVMDRPWSKKEFPAMARWLDLNEEPLKLIVAATRRSRYYTPMIASSEDDAEMLIAVLLPILQETRGAARLLKARAMYRLDQGQVEAAWGDLLACHRLARLVGEDPTLVGALVSIAVDAMACDGDARLIHHGRLRPEQARRMLADLQSLGRLPSMAQKLNTGERCVYLDCVCMLARGRMDPLDLVGGGPEGAVGGMLRAAGSVMIDWDLILRQGNTWYDRMIEALERPTHAQRAEASDALEQEIRETAERVKDPKKLAFSFLRGETPRQVVSRRIGDMLSSLLLPAVMAARTAEDRGVTQARLNEIAFALAAFRAEQGRYPKDLAQLAPKYIAEVPTDLFTNKAFRYKPGEKGYLIYSLGPNMKDNGGKVEYLDEEKAAPGEDTSQWDDYRLRMPPETD